MALRMPKQRWGWCGSDGKWQFLLQDLQPYDVRCWGVGQGASKKPAPMGRLAHRIIGEWKDGYPHGPRHETACRSELSNDVQRYDRVEDIPTIYRICLRCTEKDETVA